jgi:hypothetical protein
MRSTNKTTHAGQTQRTYARLAGVLLLGAIVIAIGSGTILSHIAGDGTFAQTAARIAASERLYRVAMTSVVIVTLSSSLLAFALYATLKPFNGLIAQLGMIFSLADSFLALVVRMCGFVKLHFYLSSSSSGPIGAESLSDLMRTIAGAIENLGGISFGIGSCLFFYLFFQSKYIPRVISALGFVASAIWAALYCANLIFPEDHALFLNICFPLMALAEVTTGFYLIVFEIKIELPNSESARSTAINAS